MDCFGTCFTHAQTCDNVRVQSATLWTASVHALHMPRPVIMFVLKVLRYGLLRYMTHAQTCDNVRGQSATLWTASVHAFHMPKPVITFVFKVLRYGLPSVHAFHMPKPVITFVFKVLRYGLLQAPRVVQLCKGSH